MKKQLSGRPLSKISVGDIVDDCQLSRNSFYYHFEDKYDLVNWIFYTELVEELSRQQFTSGWELVERICCFFGENRAFYTNALSETGQNSFSEYFSQVMTALITARSEEMFTDDEDHEFYVLFFIDAFLAALGRWLRRGADVSPQKLAELMKNAATGAAARTIE